jgi:hypothetical protein
MRDLIGALKENGFDVWVLTASPQHVVEPVAELAGISRDRVIGIRTVVSEGLTTADLEECGTAADNTLITFDEGKRCWINKVIFRETVDSQLAVNPDPAKRPVFVAGDSDTDIAMLKDATFLKLAINRNKTQIMCNAYSDYLGRWIVQPMFIAPRPCLTTPYACTSATDATGAPIRDESGAPMVDQDDAVCALP